MEEIDFAEIKRWLEWGDIKLLATECGISPNQATSVMQGKIKNFAFLEKVIAKAMANKSRIVNGMERLKAISA